MTKAEGDVARLRAALGRIAKHVDRRMPDDGLTRSELSVLGTVARERTIRVGDLAEIEGVNPTMLSRILGKLEADGLVTRSAAQEDRRVVHVGITSDGTKLHTRRRRERTTLLAQHLQTLPDGRAAELLAALDALEALADSLAAVAGKPLATAGPAAR